MIAQTPFDSERLRYREISLQDTENLVKWRSAPSVTQYFLNPKPIDDQQHIDWYLTKYLPDENRIDFIILTKDTCTPIGVVALTRTGDDTADINYSIGEQAFLRRGYAKESVRALINRMSSCGIAKFRAIIHRNNNASIGTAKSLGFQYKGERGNFIEMEFTAATDKHS